MISTLVYLACGIGWCLACRSRGLFRRVESSDTAAIMGLVAIFFWLPMVAWGVLAIFGDWLKAEPRNARAARGATDKKTDR